jgi:transposase
MPIVGVSRHGDDPEEDRLHHMDDHNEDPKPVRRIEVISGVGRRRRWSAEEKARIVAESFAPGAIVAEVARRHDARAQQVHGWRRDAREGRLVLPADRSAHERLSFAPVVLAAETPMPPPRASKTTSPLIEIESRGVMVRVRDGAETSLIEAMLRVLRERA